MNPIPEIRNEESHIENLGCVFPGKCLMSGDHLQSDCHTGQMAEWLVEYTEKIKEKIILDD